MPKPRLRKLSSRSDYDEWVINLGDIRAYRILVKRWPIAGYYAKELEHQVSQALGYLNE